jgi:hypothetical protein
MSLVKGTRSSSRSTLQVKAVLSICTGTSRRQDSHRVYLKIPHQNRRSPSSTQFLTIGVEYRKNELTVTGVPQNRTPAARGAAELHKN